MKPLDRINYLQKKLKEQDLAGALLAYSRNVFYYTGTAQPSYLAVLPDDYRLFVRSGYDFARKDVFQGIENVEEERRLDNISKKLSGKFQGGNRRIGTELDILTVEQFGQFRKAFHDCEFVNISPAILDERKTKDAGEIERIRAACRAIHQGHEAVLASLKEGVTELELAAAVENAHRLAGHEGIFFIRQPDFFMSRGPISSGENLFKTSGVVYTITGVGLSASVPAGPSRRRLAQGDLLMVDIPVHVGGYHADQTRTYCVGKAGTETMTMYNDLKAIADHLIERMKAGMKCSDIYKMAVEKAAALGRETQFQSFGGGKRSRLIGHGIGIELNEPPIPSEYDNSPVDNGYVIALDMHMLDESAGVVKLEDMILIKEDGNEILTTTDRVLFEV
ncbi:MAG TPA: Xaa-Pro peptidase family protein [Syntrophales bacterium]|nr:Xaa-Pro peptidase family protein [Syntrophales bacterium]